ncbi:MAG TPA: hypothetical protein VH063_09795 [Gaiellaceae bacterium]|nr:hypothetical protein [Gaiellaceae bacterium]
MSNELTAFVQSGVAVAVATRDEELRPTFARGWGPVVSHDGTMLALCVGAEPESATLSNLERTGAIAVGFSPPTRARALQVKGTSLSIEVPGPAALELAERHLDAFCAEAESIGFSPELSRRLYEPSELVLVRFTVAEAFEQTPGPTAGRPL